MAEIMISRPEASAVSMAAAKSNLRVDGDYLDDVLEQWIEGIVEIVEHEIGQRLMRQTWRVILDSFAAGRNAGSADVCTDSIALPHPVLAVKSVWYVDSAGAHQQLPETAFGLVRDELSTSLVPKFGAAWPASYGRGSVQIDVECGFGDDPKDVPACIRLYILAKLVEQFDPTSRPEKDTNQSVYLERMLDRCRTYR